MHLLFPSDPFAPAMPDEAYAEEFAAMRATGLQCSLFSFEDFEAGRFRAKPAIPPEAEVVYRGWMLTPDAYVKLSSAVESGGARLRTSPNEYRHCHYLPEWYASCQQFTPETRFFLRNSDFAAGLADADWPGYFVKDYVKSLTTARGSVAASVKEVGEIVLLIEQYRGQVEGGVCVRRLEALLPETEERYFVIGGRAFARDGDVPPVVQEIAGRVASPFFSVDMVRAQSGSLRLIELGDGQVSDRKKWPATRFAEALSES
ncbi:MAG: hypothetical protein EON93_02990 [Burkholderiales bacterium]|nr:MAG: hypothetical protein EON93_02990 [Burkholderiales bacterium]